MWTLDSGVGLYTWVGSLVSECGLYKWVCGLASVEVCINVCALWLVGVAYIHGCGLWCGLMQHFSREKRGREVGGSSATLGCWSCLWLARVC